jgi:hypothetical protein
MIEITLTECQWGTDKMVRTEEEGPGVQINLRDSDSGTWYHIPFSGESLIKLIQELIDGLNESQRVAIVTSLLASSSHEQAGSDGV